VDLVRLAIAQMGTVLVPGIAVQAHQLQDFVKPMGMALDGVFRLEFRVKHILQRLMHRH
jgi:hypothetical protein